MGKDSLMSYLKLNDNRYNLTGNEMVCDGQRLYLYLSAEELSVQDIKREFSNHDEFIVYDCIKNMEKDEEGLTKLNDAGEPIIIESDEYVATTFEGFTRIVAINYDIDLDTYEVVLVSPMDIDARIADMETAMNFLLMGGE